MSVVECNTVHSMVYFLQLIGLENQNCAEVARITRCLQFKSATDGVILPERAERREIQIC